MKIVIFDDKLSLVHVVFGLFTIFIPPLFFLYTGYQILEFSYKKGKGETTEHLIGDFFEYFSSTGIFFLFFTGIS